MFQWEEENINFLIENVKKNPCLWNPSCKNYKNKGMKQLKWMEIVNDFNNYFKRNLTYAEAVKKWNNLKTYFSSQKQKIQIAKKSGAGAETSEMLIEENVWKHYKSLDFLASNTEPLPSVNNFSASNLEILKTNSAPTTSNGKGEETGSSSTSNTKIQVLESILIQKPLPVLQLDDSISTEDSSSLFSPPLPPSSSESCNTPQQEQPVPQTSFAQTHPQKRKRTKFNTEPHMLLEKCIQSSEEIQKLCRDQKPIQNVFGHYIQEELTKLDEDLQIQAKRRISNVIYELQEEQLKRKNL